MTWLYRNRVFRKQFGLRANARDQNSASSPKRRFFSFGVLIN